MTGPKKALVIVFNRGGVDPWWLHSSPFLLSGMECRSHPAEARYN